MPLHQIITQKVLALAWLKVPEGWGERESAHHTRRCHHQKAWFCFKKGGDATRPFEPFALTVQSKATDKFGRGEAGDVHQVVRLSVNHGCEVTGTKATLSSSSSPSEYCGNLNCQGKNPQWVVHKIPQAKKKKKLTLPPPSPSLNKNPLLVFRSPVTVGY